MIITNDESYSDVFVSNGEGDIHDFYYVSPRPIDDKSFYFQVNRTGIEACLPSVFFIERTAKTAKCCELFCILSGKGKLSYRGKNYDLRENQIVLLLDGEAHAYNSSPEDPLGNSWLEFYGAQSHVIMQYLIKNYGPILEGSIFKKICEKLTLIQQRLMMKDTYRPSLEIYEILLTLLDGAKEQSVENSAGMYEQLQIAEAYIDGHLRNAITNQELADLCKISLSYFMKIFHSYYRASPQQYIMRRRIAKAKYALLRTDESIETIADMLGFCNASHFIRHFKVQEQMTPAQYRKAYRLHT